MTANESESPSAVVRRGRVAKSAFVVLVLAPSLAISVFTVRLCTVTDIPLIVAMTVIVACFFLVDHFAYHTFCRIVVKREGILYRGGGLFWSKVRGDRLLPWRDYVYTIVANRKGYYERLHVIDGGGRGALNLYRPGAAYDEFRGLLRKVLIHDRDVRVEWIPRRRSRGRGTLLHKKENTEIIGDWEFIRKTVEALDLLKDRDPVNYERVQEYVRRIESVESNCVMDFESATVEVGRKTAFGDDARWYASTIVHEAYHYMLQHRFRFSWYNPRNQKKHEQICSRAQIRTLRRIGGSEEQLEYLQNESKRRLSELYEEGPSGKRRAYGGGK